MVRRVQLRTLQRVAARPGVLEAHLISLSLDVEGCCRAGLLERRGAGASTALYLTPRGRAALSR